MLICIKQACLKNINGAIYLAVELEAYNMAERTFMDSLTHSLWMGKYSECSDLILSQEGKQIRIKHLKHNNCVIFVENQGICTKIVELTRCKER
jgi:hypothetical protein